MTDPVTLQQVGAWLEDGPDRAPTRVLEAVIERVPSVPQRHSRWHWTVPRRPRERWTIVLAAATLAAVAVSAVGSGLLRLPDVPAVPGPTPSPSASAGPSASPTLVPWPAERLPGYGPSAAGTYAATLGQPTPIAMHHVGDGGEIVLIMTYSVGCLADGSGPPGPDRLIDGRTARSYVPYTPTKPFGSRDPGDTTSVHVVELGERQLCIFLTWSEDATAERRAALEAILDTIRLRSDEWGQYHVSWVLDHGWDRG